MLEGKQITAPRLEKMILGIADVAGPEARLLAAILAQAVIDATQKDRKCGPSADKSNALGYFRRGGHKYLCELLCISPNAPQRWIELAKANKLTSN